MQRQARTSVLRLMVAVFVCALVLAGIGGLMRMVYEPAFVSPSDRCLSNLSQIGLALHNYASTYGCFPPAYTVDAEGKPMHSWRALILPYLGADTLWGPYNFDEPWNGPNNSKLADRMPSVYECPTDPQHSPKHGAAWTNYVAVVGPGKAFPGNVRGVTIEDIRDGTTNTIMIVEIANDRIDWMEPRDLNMTKLRSPINRPRPSISSKGAGAAVLMLNGARRRLDPHAMLQEIRAMTTIDGGEPSIGTNSDHFMIIRR